MNSLDIVLLILLIWGGYSGFKKGFITELLASLLLLFGLIKGMAIFYELLPILENKLPALITCLPITLAIVMFLVGGSLMYLVTKVIKSILSITLLGVFDHILGALLGICKSALLISLLIYFWHCSTFPPLPAAYINGSEVLPLLEPIVPKILQSITGNPVHE